MLPAILAGAARVAQVAARVGAGAGRAAAGAERAAVGAERGAIRHLSAAQGARSSSTPSTQPAQSFDTGTGPGSSNRLGF